MAIKELQRLKIIVIIAEGVEEGLCHLEPAHIEDELQQGEDRHVEIDWVVVVALRGVQELPADDGEGEVGVRG